MLKLDDSKIRKGKPIGLPYVGSKKKISKKIVEIIKQNFGDNIPVYDIFGGGGAITAECLLNGMEVHYNDLDEDITKAFERVVSKDREWLKKLIVSRDEFMKIKGKEIKDVDDFLKLLVNSFGNNKKSYLYSKSMSDVKYNLACEIIKNDDTFVGYRQTETYKRAIFEFRLEQLGQLQQLGKLQRLQQLERLEISNEDYTAFSNVENSIIYLDPPYENTIQESYIGNTFDSLAFYDWAFNMAKNNVVIISSYQVSDERFKTAYEFKTARSTYAGGNNGKRYEKLFMAI